MSIGAGKQILRVLHRHRPTRPARLRLILAIGTLAAFVAQKIAIPDVAIFLIAGIVLGPHTLGLVDIKADSALNEIIVLFGGVRVRHRARQQGGVRFPHGAGLIQAPTTRWLVGKLGLLAKDGE
jgi:hypothetical protein